MMPSTPPSKRNRIWRWVVAGIVVVVVGATVFFILRGRVSGPTYQRSAQITDIAWGKDRALFMRVHWVVAEHRHGDVWRTITSFSEDAVYRLDPVERVVRMLPMAEAKVVIDRWPKKFPWGETGNGWVGGRYNLQAVLSRQGNGYEYHGTSLRDFQTGETSSISVHFIAPQLIDHARLSARLSPDDRYMVYQDSPARRLRIRWIATGREAVIPDSIIPIKTWFDGRETLVYQPFHLHPTTQGLLDAELKLLIDPVTFDTKVGWDPFAGFLLGHKYDLSPDGNYVAGFDKDRVGTTPRNTDLPRIVGFTFPTEVVTGRLPDSWKNLDEYPEEYSVGGVKR